MKQIAMIAVAMMLGLGPVCGTTISPLDGNTVAVLSATKAKKEMRVLVVTTNPEMHCQNCEKRIKENIRFEPGVRKIETSLEKQQVRITYNPAKTDVKKLTEAFAKIGYEVKVLSDQDEGQASDKKEQSKSRKK